MFEDASTLRFSFFKSLCFSAINGQLNGEPQLILVFQQVSFLKPELSLFNWTRVCNKIHNAEQNDG